MRVFPKSISQETMRKHLRHFSPSLFPFYAEYLTVIGTEVNFIIPGNLYVCPLCTQNYFADLAEGIAGNAEFSIDHLPPKSIGGKFEIITCKNCNNKFGTPEKEILDLLNFGTVPDPKHGSIFPHSSVTDLNTGNNFRVSLNVNNKTADIRFRPSEKEGNPLLKALIQKIHSGEQRNLRVNIGSPNLERIAVALLKSAYLVCFAWWGYSFVYSEQGKFIRKVLNGELKYPATVPTTWSDINEGNRVNNGISLLLLNGKKVGFIVQIECRTEAVQCVAGILIPAPTKDGFKQLETLDSISKQSESTALQAITLPRMVAPNGYAFAFEHIEVHKEN